MSEWRKSSYSGSQTDCVEVGRGVGIRDSKSPSQHIPLGTTAWSSFLSTIKQMSQLDLPTT